MEELNAKLINFQTVIKNAKC